MTQLVTHSANKEVVQCDWLQQLRGLAYAYGTPEVTGRIKQSPEHFVVTEVMDIEPSGQGEHYWLDITKERLNTDAIAKSLARFSGVANRDIGYSGLKDFHAVTRQWFSVWKPKGAELDWSKYVLDGVTLNLVTKHSRKIKRGTHKANRFQIRVVDLASVDNIQESLDSRLEKLRLKGVPNYFGEQRFGRNANNLTQALDMFAGKKRVKDRHLRGILLSSARSWLFNNVLSARIKAATWQSLYLGEPANLNGSNSVFTVTDVEAEKHRLETLDIHPTGPLWGENDIKGSRDMPMSKELYELEQAAMDDYQLLKKGIESARIEYQRRATRLLPSKLQWRYDQGDLCLSFELQRGQFATSVLRELVCTV